MMKNKMKYVIVAGIVAIIILVAFMLYSFKEEGRENELSVDAMYLLKEEGKGETMNASAIIYLTNVGGESGNIKIIAYLMERWKGVAVARNEVKIGKIAADKTKEVQIPMEMRNKSYEIEVLVFEDDLLKIKGGGALRIIHYSVDNKVYWDASLEEVHFEKVHQ